MVTSIFLVFLITGLIFWKGGEPFRWIGDGTVIIGESISRFGDFVDELIKEGKDVQRTIKDLKETVNGGGNKK